jgi:hypothetical protein
MKLEYIKQHIDFKRRGLLERNNVFDEIEKFEYLLDEEGNYFVDITPLESKLIDTILELEERIKKLEEVKK